jgi:hypothetical protein
MRTLRDLPGGSPELDDLVAEISRTLVRKAVPAAGGTAPRTSSPSGCNVFSSDSPTPPSPPTASSSPHPAHAIRCKSPRTLSSSARDLIAVAAPDGTRMPGQLSDGETRWSFVPDEHWRPGRYELRVHPSLEDPAGNRICAAFEQVAQSAITCDAMRASHLR